MNTRRSAEPGWAPPGHQAARWGTALGLALLLVGRLSVAGVFPAEINLTEIDDGDGENGTRFIRDFYYLDAVAIIDDVNGDGLADMAIYDDSRNEIAGRVYIVYGQPDGLAATFDVLSLFPENGGDGSQGVVILEPEGPFDYEGVVEKAGDLNGDGLADLVVSVPRATVGGVEFVGRIYVLFGRAEGFATVTDLTALFASEGGDGSAGFVVEGLAADARLGTDVAGALDINGDGVDDIAFGANPQDNVEGTAYLLFGRTSGFPAEFDLTSLLPENGGDGSEGVVLATDRGLRFSAFGEAVASVGDVTNDGLDDLLIGSPFELDPALGFTDGHAYLLHGSTAPFPPTINVTDWFEANGGDGSVGTVIDSVGTRGGIGAVASPGGDINGDGIADMIVSDTAAYQFAGEAYVIFGRADGFGAEFDPERLQPEQGGDGSEGFVLRGGTWDGLGKMLQSGDFDGDGLDDVAVGADTLNTGTVYVYFGREGGPGEGRPNVFHLTEEGGGDGNDGFAITAREVDGSYQFGQLLSSGRGDVTGDGVDDLLTSTGDAFLLRGRQTPFGGRFAGMDAQFATCTNITTGARVTSPLPAQAVDVEIECEAGGLTVSRGDRLAVRAQGTNVGPRLMGAGRRLLPGARVSCTNRSTGERAVTSVDGNGEWDCAAAGLTLASGDRLDIVVSGTAR